MRSRCDSPKVIAIRPLGRDYRSIVLRGLEMSLEAPDEAEDKPLLKRLAESRTEEAVLFHLRLVSVALRVWREWKS